MDYTIKSEKLQLTVTDEGGSMRSLIYLPTGEERLWQGGSAWSSRDVVIFPIIGHAAPYTVNGQTYSPKSHGVVRYARLNADDIGENFVQFSLEESDETLKTYPFAFLFRLRYELRQNSLKVTYFVQSKEGSMPFYVGGHPGLRAPGGEAIIEFSGGENAVEYPLGEDRSRYVGLKRIVANKALFAECKTLQLGGLHGDITLSTEDGFSYTFNSACPVWAFWSNEKEGDYVCAEPWWGINDFPAAPRELSLKPFVNFDDGAGQAFSYTLTIDKD